jgi:hypothetical protein
MIVQYLIMLFGVKGEARMIMAVKSVGRFEVFTAVTMKECVFWEVTPCGSCKN